MGTVQKIVDSLLKLSDDKKSNLTSRYQEHSLWLGNELSLIRELIHQDPRGSNSGNANNNSTAASSSSKSQTSVSEGNEENFSRQKRKSPETALIPSQEEKQSPEQKKFSSSDPESAYQSAGLPSDLNRLTKEQLVKELQKRGNKTLSLKVLKQVLIDALKELLLAEQRKDSLSSNFDKIALTENNSSEDNQFQRDSDTISDDHETECTFAAIDSISTDMHDTKQVQDMPLVVEAPFSETQQVVVEQPPSARKGSLMSEFRNMFTGKESAAKQEEESDESKQLRLKIEFEARQMRHRTSQGAARNSQGAARNSQGAALVASAAAEPVVEAAAKSSDEGGLKSPAKEEVAVSSASPVPTSPDNIWMEVASPVPDKAPEESEDREASPAVAVTVSSAKEEVSQALPEAPESKEPNNKCIETPAIGALAVPPSGTAKVEEIVGVAAAPMVKKPINLLSQTSFIDKTATKGVLVPALEKARLAKAADEAKLLLKKRELEKKKAAYMAAANQSSASAASVPSNSTIRPGTAATPASSLVNGKPVTKPALMSSATGGAVPRVINGGGLAVITSASSVAAVTGAVASTAATGTAGAASTNPLATKKGLLAYLDKDKVKTAATTAAVPVDTEAIKSPVETENKPDFSFDINVCTLSALPPAPTVTAVPVIPPAAATEKKLSILAAAPEEAAPASSSSKENNGPVPAVAAKPEESVVDVPAVVTKPAETAVKAPSVAVITPATAVQTPSQTKLAITGSAISSASTKEVLRDISSEVVNAAQPEDDDISADQYQMDDRESSGSSGSGTDDDNEQEKKKFIPDWAKGTVLREALERQYGLGGNVPVDPDLIFPEVQTCSLEEIFGSREGRGGAYAKRTSSAKWDADELTLVEKRTYRSQMGYNSQTGASSVKASAH